MYKSKICLENAGLFLQLDLPSALIRHENGAKPTLTWSLERLVVADGCIVLFTFPVIGHSECFGFGILQDLNHNRSITKIFRIIKCNETRSARAASCSPDAKTQFFHVDVPELARIC